MDSWFRTKNEDLINLVVLCPLWRNKMYHPVIYIGILGDTVEILFFVVSVNVSTQKSRSTTWTQKKLTVPQQSRICNESCIFCSNVFEVLTFWFPALNHARHRAAPVFRVRCYGNRLASSFVRMLLGNHLTSKLGRKQRISPHEEATYRILFLVFTCDDHIVAKICKGIWITQYRSFQIPQHCQANANAES